MRVGDLRKRRDSWRDLRQTLSSWRESSRGDDIRRSVGDLERGLRRNGSGDLLRLDVKSVRDEQVAGEWREDRQRGWIDKANVALLDCLELVHISFSFS